MKISSHLLHFWLKLYKLLGFALNFYVAFRGMRNFAWKDNAMSFFNVDLAFIYGSLSAAVIPLIKVSLVIIGKCQFFLGKIKCRTSRFKAVPEVVFFIKTEYFLYFSWVSHFSVLYCM